MSPRRPTIVYNTHPQQRQMGEQLSRLHWSHQLLHRWIYGDSQAANLSLEAATAKSTSVIMCRRSLYEMAEQFDINLICVPGHRDIVGNCIADALARRGYVCP